MMKHILFRNKINYSYFKMKSTISINHKPRVYDLRFESPPSTPLILLCGYLGSGKTTLLLHLLKQKNKPKVAILMNEFGDIGIDTTIIKSKNVAIKELLEGCVCCSLIGEFKAAIAEIITTYHPELIIVETTGIAEADNLIIDIKEVPNTTLKAVLTVVDAHLAMTAQNLGHNITLQIKSATHIIVNKMDLISKAQQPNLIQSIKNINPSAQLFTTINGKISWADILSPPIFIQPKKKVSRKAISTTIPASRIYQTFSVKLKDIHLPSLKKALLQIPPNIERIKGFVTANNTTYLLNFVRGRYTLTPSTKLATPIVIIGKGVMASKRYIITILKGTEKK